MLLKDRVAIITGGAGVNGLGFATARMMAAQGARVAILDLASSNPSGAAAELGAQHIGIVADVTNKEQCEKAVREVLERFGRSRVRPGDDGFGLGLSIVRAIAEAHGGAVSVHDAEPRGTRVEMDLPARTAGAAAPTTADESSTSTDTTGEATWHRS